MAAFLRFRDKPFWARTGVALGVAGAILTGIFAFEAIFFVDWKNGTSWTKYGQRPFPGFFPYFAGALLGSGVLAAALAGLSRRNGIAYGALVAAPLAALFALPSSAEERDAVWWIQRTVPAACILIFGASVGRGLDRAA